MLNFVRLIFRSFRNSGFSGRITLFQGFFFKSVTIFFGDLFSKGPFFRRFFCRGLFFFILLQQRPLFRGLFFYLGPFFRGPFMGIFFSGTIFRDFFSGTIFRGIFFRDHFSGNFFSGTIFRGIFFPGPFFGEFFFRDHFSGFFSPRALFPGTFFPRTVAAIDKSQRNRIIYEDIFFCTMLTRGNNKSRRWASCDSFYCSFFVGRRRGQFSSVSSDRAICLGYSLQNITRMPSVYVKW